MPKISVIMPVYNVEKFVGKAIESVLNQKFTDFELLAVDDGSLDRSGKILDEYSKMDKRIIVIHKENGGAPEARNMALENAQGKYIYFIDSDDWIEKEYLQIMYDLAEKNKADLVVTGFLMEYYQNGKEKTYETYCKNEIYKTKKEFRENAYKYLNNSLLSLPWNKLYLAKNIRDENIRFPNTKWDDHHFNMEYLMNVERVVMSSTAMYHWYRSREGSETMINYSDPNMFEKRIEHYEHILRLYKYWNLKNDRSTDEISCYFVGRVFQCIQELADNKNVSYKDKRKKVKDILNNKYTIDALKNAKSLSGKFKILVIPMKIQNVTLSLLFGKNVSLVRKIMPRLFIRLKEKEVHGK